MLVPLPDTDSNDEWIEIPIDRKFLPTLERQAEANEKTRDEFIIQLIHEGIRRHKWDSLE